jgi:outer membrane protein
MKKNLSLILNVVLIIAVGVLYYLHFSCSANCENPDAANDTTATLPPVVMKPEDIKASKIVYINSDVLNDKYDFVKDISSAALAKQARLENTYRSKGQKFEQDYQDLQQKAGQGLLSENQLKAAEEDLMKRKGELDQMEQQLQMLVEEVQKSNEEVRQTVIDYVKEYNKNGQYNYILTYTEGPGGIVLMANDSLDITDEVLEGLNAQYKAKKENKKK